MYFGRVVAFAWLATWALRLGAQEVQVSHKFPWSSQAWLEDGRLVTLRENEHPRKVTHEIRGGHGGTQFVPPPSGLKGPRVCVRQGHILCTTQEHYQDKGSEGRVRRWNVYGLNGYDETKGAWDPEPLGSLRVPKSLRLHALSEDRLLGIAVRPDDYVHQGQRHLFAIFKRNARREFVLERFEDAGLELPALDAKGGWNYPVLSTIWMTGQVYPCGDHVVLATPHGLFWVFDEKGRMRRLHRIHGAFDEATLRSRQLWPGVILGCQPTREGDLLVSALGLDAVNRAMAVENEPDPVGFDGPTQASRDHYDAKQRKAFQRILGEEPAIEWFSLDPRLGRMDVMAPPKGLPGVLRNQREYEAFNWVFKPDGNLRLFSESEWRKEVEALKVKG